MAEKDLDFFAEARRRRADAVTFWSDIFEDYDEDIRMVFGDQWKKEVRNQREDDGRPVLQFNEERTIVNLSVNETRQNPTSPKFNPRDEGASEETAQVLMGIARHCNYASQGDVARETAIVYSTAGGLGYYGLCTDWADMDADPTDPSAWNQEIKYRRFRDPKMVLFDPKVQEPDFSDAGYCFVQRPRMPWQEYKKKYPDASLQGFPVDDDIKGWADEKGIDICEYWQVEENKRVLLLVDAGDAGKVSVFRDELEKGEKPIILRTRDVIERTVIMDLINGCERLEETAETVWCGIPIIPVLGEEVVIQGNLKLLSLVRNLHSAQQLENAFGSGIGERIGLETNIPYIGMKGQFRTDRNWNGKEKNKGFREFDAVMLPDGSYYTAPPARQPMEAAIESMTIASKSMIDFMRRGSGYVDAVENPSAQNSLSGIAIKRRQGQTEKVNYHFQDNLTSRAIWYEGKLLLAAIPKIYDTPRAQRIIGEDGAISTAMITTALDDGSTPFVPGHEDKQHHILNRGRYDVTVSSGQSYPDKVQETLDTLVNMAQSDPMVFAAYQDIIFKLRGMPELEARAKLLLPPQVQAAMNGQQAIPPQAQAIIAQSQQQNMQLKQALTKTLMDLKGKVVDNQGKLKIEALKIAGGITEAAIKAQIETNSAQAIAFMQDQTDSIDRMLAQFQESELAPDPGSGPLGLHPDKPEPIPPQGQGGPTQ